MQVNNMQARKTKAKQAKHTRSRGKHAKQRAEAGGEQVAGGEGTSASFGGKRVMQAGRYGYGYRYRYRHRDKRENVIRAN